MNHADLKNIETQKLAANCIFNFGDRTCLEILKNRIGLELFEFYWSKNEQDKNTDFTKLVYDNSDKKITENVSDLSTCSSSVTNKNSFFDIIAYGKPSCKDNQSLFMKEGKVASKWFEEGFEEITEAQPDSTKLPILKEIQIIKLNEKTPETKKEELLKMIENAKNVK